MKGLRQYIKKHGKHFTEELAYKAAGKKWSSKQIEKATQGEVYYNVTASTLGDMIFLINTYRKYLRRKSECVSFALCIIGDYQYYGGVIFDTWLEDNKGFDFTPYI